MVVGREAFAVAEIIVNLLSLFLFELFIFVFESCDFVLVSRRFLEIAVDASFFVEYLQVEPLYVLFDCLNLFECECVVALVVVAVLVKSVNVLLLLELEAIIKCPGALQFLVRPFDLVLDVRQICRTLQLVLAHK